MISAAPLSTSLFEQEMAYGRLCTFSAIAGTRALCHRDLASISSNSPRWLAHHFRTPSPDGQQCYFQHLLSVLHSRARAASHRRNSADRAVLRRQGIHETRSDHYLDGKEQTSRGRRACPSKHTLSQSSPLVAWQPVVTPRVSKRLSAVPWAQAQPRSHPATWQPAQRSARQATCCSVRRTQADAELRKGAFRVFSHDLLTTAFGVNPECAPRVATADRAMPLGFQTSARPSHIPNIQNDCARASSAASRSGACTAWTASRTERPKRNKRHVW